MRWLAIVLALVAPAPAAAETATVLGGEHPEFTRIVVAADQPGDWRFGRTPDGYELQLGDAVTGYDLSKAFERIPKDRVSGLYRDPGTGRLRLALSCACHAIAFEFRPGTVVIDIKSGPPPEGSSFELALDTALPPDPAPASPAAAPGYDWIAAARGTDTRPAENPGLPMPLPTGDVSLAPLRDALLAQISKGVAEGVVELAEGGLNAPRDGGDQGPWARITVGDVPGMATSTIRDPDPALAADGAACLPDAALAIETWGGQGPVAEQLAPARQGLVTEFDAPVDDAILRAARFYLSLGFGAEARQVLDLRPDPALGEGALLATLSHIVDLEPTDPGPLAGQEACDTAAALWRLLADVASGRDAPLAGLNQAAVKRAFSALPPHLRRHFGPALVTRFLAAGEEETARHLRDAILRVPGDPGPDVALMEAEFNLAQGDPDAAARVASAVRDDQGRRDLPAMLALVQATLDGGPPLPADVPDDLAAQLGLIDDPAQEARVLRAMAAALALTNDPARAFALLDRSPDSFDQLWAITAATLPEDLLLTQAIPAAANGQRTADAAVNLTVASRLFDSGFPREALAWLGPLSGGSPDAVLLGARAYLALQDPPAAIATLSGRADAPAMSLRAQAVLQLGDAASAAEAYDRAGDAAGRERAQRLAADWTGVAAAGSDPWAAAAALVATPPAAEGGPITRGTALVDASAAARAAVTALLGDSR